MYAHICEPDNWFHSVICIKLSLSLGNVHFELIQFPIMTDISYQAIQHPQIFLEKIDCGIVLSCWFAEALQQIQTEVIFFEKTLIPPTPAFVFVKGDIETVAVLVLSSSLCHFVDSRHCIFRVSRSSKLSVAQKKHITTFFFLITLVIKDIGTLSCAPTSAVWNLGVTDD